MVHDPIPLAQRLIQANTVNPPGNESGCLEMVAELLHDAGAEVQLHPMDEGRGNLIARIEGEGGEHPLCFTGHVDTVPIGLAPWSFDPFCGTIHNGKLLGRGSSDMKGGVAAFVSAACHYASVGQRPQSIELVITSGEETGCEGAIEVAKRHKLPKARALVVAEPTSNAVALGHKGVLWMKALFLGKTAHGSMPHLGDNAAYKAADALQALRTFKFKAPAHELGLPTLNAGYVTAGININSVPDRAEIGIDIRTTPSVVHADIRERLQDALDKAEFTTVLDLPAIWTDSRDLWISRAKVVAETICGPSSIESVGVPYFTDAAALSDAMGRPPVIILGPGEASLAHRTDEYCDVARIHEAKKIYCGLMQMVE